MERLPDYIKQLRWGKTLYFFNELDVCVYRMQGHFDIIKCSTGETTRVNLKLAHQFVACNKTKRLFFVRRSFPRPDYSKPYVEGEVKNNLYFYVYDLVKNTYKKSKPFRGASLFDASLRSFLSAQEDYMTIINIDGEILNVSLDTLEVEKVMRLDEFVEDPFRFFHNPWYRTEENIYETEVSRQKQWYEEPYDPARDNLFAKLDLSKKTLEFRPGDGGWYDTSVYLEDAGVWVHQKPNITNRMKATSFLFDIRKDDQIIWQFEIPCSPFIDSGLFWRGRNIFSFSANTFVICFTTMIYLCDLQTKSLEGLFFVTGMADVFFDKANGHIIPVFFSGVTDDMVTLDDFTDVSDKSG